jgi:hypothetical protein
MGQLQGKKTALELLQKIKDGEQIDEINFVTHSMGAAFAEGMIEEMMKYPQLAGLMKKGEIIHFSACDGDGIYIPEETKGLKRTQVNYTHDTTLGYADNGATETGGYQIKHVSRFAVIQSDIKKMHPQYKSKEPFDFHFDSKSNARTWDYLKAFDKKVKSNPTDKEVKIKYEDAPQSEDGTTKK